MLKELASLLCSLFVPRRSVNGGGKLIYGENLSTVGLTDFTEFVTVTSLPYVVPFDAFVTVVWEATFAGSPYQAWFPILFNGRCVHTTVETAGRTYTFSFPVKKGIRISAGELSQSVLKEVTVYKIK